MITALKCSGLSYAFCCVVEKNKNVIHQLRSVRIGKNCALCLEYRPRPQAEGGIQDLGHSFSQYGPPGWWITYMYLATSDTISIPTLCVTMQAASQTDFDSVSQLIL